MSHAPALDPVGRTKGVGVAHGFDDWADWGDTSRPGASAQAAESSDGSSWDDSGASRPQLKAAGPPLINLWLALAVGAVGGLAALALGGSIIVAVVAWLLAGPGAFSLLARFTSQDTRLRAAPLYVSPAWTSLAYRSTVVIALLGIVAAAWRIADWAGRTW